MMSATGAIPGRTSGGWPDPHHSADARPRSASPSAGRPGKEVRGAGPCDRRSAFPPGPARRRGRPEPERHAVPSMPPARGSWAAILRSGWFVPTGRRMAPSRQRLKTAPAGTTCEAVRATTCEGVRGQAARLAVRRRVGSASSDRQAWGRVVEQAGPAPVEGGAVLGVAAGNRRLTVRYERRADILTAVLHLGCTLICAGKLRPAGSQLVELPVEAAIATLQAGHFNPTGTRCPHATIVGMPAPPATAGRGFL
jgi:hypothetical protein